MKELNFLTELIATILYNKPSPSVPKEFDWSAFVNLVLQNGFTALVYDRLRNILEVPEKVQLVFKQRYDADLQRSVLQDYYAEQILKRFEQEGIKCLPLKGIILRHLYPQPYMRSMSDLDILIDNKRLKETRKIMPELGFEAWRYDEHHDIYSIKPCVNVELHKLLIVGEMEDYFQIGFERAHIKEGASFIYEMSLEDFYIHVLGHMAYHFAHGGVGIRLVLDVRVYLDKYGDMMDREYINQELEKAGLYTFAQHAEKLSEIWFKGNESNDFYDELGAYIVQSGYLGSQKHREILEVVKQSGENVNVMSRGKAVFEAIFPPYKTMTFLYPILKHMPWLYPFTWVARWITVFTKRRKNIARIYRLSQTKDDDIQKLSKLYDELDMKHLL